MPNNNFRQRGLSLVELMVAIAIGVVLTFGAVNLFLQSKISYLQDEEQARLQENGRYVLRYLARELSMAGFVGQVLRGDLVNTSLTGSNCFDYVINADLALEHHNDVSANGTTTKAPVMPSDCLVSGKHVAGSDMLMVRRTKDFPHYYQGVANTGAVIDPNSVYLRVQDSAVSVDFFRGDAISLGSTVDVWEYYPQIIFLRNYSAADGDGIPTLCRKRIASKSNTMESVQCLVEGVEDIQVEYGLDVDGDLVADRFVSDPNEPQMDTAVSARIYVLLRSINEISGYQNDRVYTLANKTLDKSSSPDGYYRRVFQTTVMLRNSEAYKF